LIQKTKKIKVGLKQLYDNPWQDFAASYPKGSIVKGIVEKIEDNGITLRYNKDITGFLPKKHLDKKYENINEFCKIGDEIEAMIIEIDPYENKLVVSIRAMIDAERKKELEKYITPSETKNITLGDILGKNIENIAKQKIKKQKKEEVENPKNENKEKKEGENLDGKE